MAASYSIHRTHRLIWNRFSGTISVADLVDLGERLRNDVHADPGYLFIEDMRGVTEDRITFNEMQQVTGNIAAYRKMIGVPLRIGLIAPSDVTFGMARMFQSLLTSQIAAEINVGRDVADLATEAGLGPDAVVLLEHAGTVSA